VAPIGNLRALAFNAFEAAPDCNLVLAAIDARMNEAYCAVYRRAGHASDERAIQIREPALASPASLAQIAEAHQVELVAGNALEIFASAFETAWPQQRTWSSLPSVSSSAASIAWLARDDSIRGRTVAPEDAAPVYVRDHVALTIAERQRAA